MTKQKLSLQMKLDKSLAEDLEIFEEFKNREKEIMINIKGYKCLSGKIIINGASFLHLKGVKHYLSSFEDYTLNYLFFPEDEIKSRVSSLVINKSEIEAFRSLDEIISDYHKHNKKE